MLSISYMYIVLPRLILNALTLQAKLNNTLTIVLVGHSSTMVHIICICMGLIFDDSRKQDGYDNILVPGGRYDNLHLSYLGKRTSWLDSKLLIRYLCGALTFHDPFYRLS